MPKEEPYLYDFYGTECVKCKEMEPLLDKLETELSVKVKKIEVWHSEKNALLMKSIEKGRFGGVPLYYNKKSKKFLFGKVKYDKLKKWALGEEGI